MGSKHTRGKWWSGKVNTDPSTGMQFVYINSTNDGMTHPICEVFGPKDFTDDVQANMNLIVRSPQMYDCLKQVLSYIDGEDIYDPNDVVNNLRNLVTEIDMEE